MVWHAIEAHELGVLWPMLLIDRQTKMNSRNNKAFFGMQHLHIARWEFHIRENVESACKTKVHEHSSSGVQSMCCYLTGVEWWSPVYSHLNTMEKHAICFGIRHLTSRKINSNYASSASAATNGMARREW